MENQNNYTVEEVEFREKSAGRLIEFMKKTDLYDKSQEFIRSENPKDILTFEGFKDFLIRINGIIREIPITDRGFDGENVSIKGLINNQRLPRQIDKENLLSKAYESLDKINKEDISYFIPLMINTIHLFKDGNSRTSRIFNILLNHFNNCDDMYSEIRKHLCISDEYINKEIKPKVVNFDTTLLLMNREGISFKNNQWPPILPVEFFGEKSRFMFTSEPFETVSGERLFEFYNYDSELMFLSAFKYLKNKDLLKKCIETKPESGNEKALSPALMEFFLTQDDFENIISGYFDLLKERVEILIDSFVEPDKYTLLDGSMTIKDKILESIK